ncbi:glycoside hydrolase family 1 protein [Sebaldella sp. S0638]|uniref:glycoside hydrolase family 1 protein n=1 Tax=Sebaldella sp. S0638 TaxID=2957809 RepID=UPI0020A15750|nr:glycoside hydrolase family 1 protein [Sebaldella sp. S0638]MCP1225935.1 glycoside hydrolase family 1 protein [Sebaldella sp. S0638]
MEKKYLFPEKFWWGASTSATQTEGVEPGDGKGENIWDYSSKEFNNRFYDGITSERTSTFYKNYKKDIKLMKDIHLNSFRTSISWSRLIPEGTGKINEKAVEFYNNVINELIEQGIEPFINLYHFDMPMVLQKKGGFENREVVEAYTEYARKCFELFGDRVKYWFTFNEPMIPAEAGYLHDRHYPYVADFKRAAKVLHNIIISHCKAVEIYRDMALQGKIGIIMDVIPVYPRSENPADLKAAEAADLFYTRSINEPILLGKYPAELIEILKEYDQVPRTEEGDLELIEKTKIDILGINYYKPRRVKAKEYEVNKNGIFMPEWFFDSYEMPGRRMNRSRGIEIYPKGIYDIAVTIKEKYNNIPWFVSENGIGIEGEEKFIENGMVQDQYRIDFLTEHLQYLHKGMEEGSNCLGYQMWTFIDCWSWINAYKNRYGFYRLDYDTQERTVKKSGLWFRDVIDNNGF